MNILTIRTFVLQTSYHKNNHTNVNGNKGLLQLSTKDNKYLKHVHIDK